GSADGPDHEEPQGRGRRRPRAPGSRVGPDLMLLAPKTKYEDNELLEDVVDVYIDAVKLEWQHMLGYALAAIAVALLWSVLVGRRRASEPWAGERWLRLALVIGLIGLGLYNALDNATCFDDAYISLRYAENFVAGKGLVY